METQYGRDARFFGKLFFCMLALFLLVVTSRAVLGLEATIDAPATIDEGQLMSVDFGSDDPTANYELYKDGDYVTNAPPYEWQTTTADAGLYQFTVYAYNANSTDNASTTVEVLDVPLSVTINEPSDVEYTTNTIPLSVTPSGQVDLCYYVLGTESNTLTQQGNDYVGEMIKPDGIYSLAFKCKQGTEIAEAETNILIDTTAPEIVTSSPADGATLDATPITLQLTTDEVADCYAWPATADESTATSMQSTDRLTHRIEISPADGTHNWLARCTDVYGNEQATPHQFSFTLDNAPTAEIRIDGGDTLRVGTYKVTVTTSEPVQNAPTLSFTYQNGGSGNVALTSETSTEWIGYLVIEDDEKEDVGSFSFSALDLSGKQGTTITEGKIFKVDTIAPEQVTGLKAEAKSDSIGLTWFYDDEIEDVEYRIYRSETKDVDMADEYAESEHREYFDFSVSGAVEYYYAVAAVDDAGNVGPLSEIALAAAVPEQVEEEQVELSATQVYEAEQLANRIEQVIFDLDAAYKELETERDEQKLLIIKQMGLLERIAQLKASLRNSQREVAALPQAGLSSERFRDRITGINDQISSAYALIPKRILVDGSITFQQPVDNGAMNMLLSKVLGIFDLGDTMTDAAFRAAYENEVKQMMDDSVVTGTVVTATVTYADRHESGYTYVGKELSVPSRQEPITVLEYLPKELASDVDAVRFSSEPVIVERDPIVQYTIPAGSTQLSYSYFLEQRVDLATARSVRSMIFPTPAAPEAAENSITGNSIVMIPGLEFLKRYWLYVLGTLVIAGLLVYYFAIDAAPAPVRTGFSGAPATGNINAFLDTLTTALRVKGIGELPVPTPQPQFTRLTRPRRRPLAQNPSHQILAAATLSEPTSAPELSLDELTSDTKLDKPLATLVLDAHQAIDNKEYIVAKRHYEAILEQLQNPLIAQTPEDKAAINLLYYKLLLFRKMQAAVDAAETRDCARLKRILTEVKGVAAKIPETGSTLVAEAKDKYEELQRLANKLAIDEEYL